MSTIMFEARLYCHMCMGHETVTVVSELGSKPEHRLSDESDDAMLAAGWVDMARGHWFCPEHAHHVDDVPVVRRG